MTIDDQLAAAASGISSMPDAEVTERLDELQARHRQRTRSEAARHAAELDAAELDWAAYELGRHYDEVGDLAAAARWYRLCASADLGDSALLLARVLDRRAGQQAFSQGESRFVSQRDELALVSDAARWYIEAYGAGHVEAAEELDEMISMHDIRRRDHRDPPARPRVARQDCTYGGLDTIMQTNDLAGATEHFQHCVACQREFLRCGGILPSRAETSTAWLCHVTTDAGSFRAPRS
jgi:TPR repeat protein